jgi:hypothetical protein
MTQTRDLVNEYSGILKQVIERVNILVVLIKLWRQHNFW